MVEWFQVILKRPHSTREASQTRDWWCIGVVGGQLEHQKEVWESLLGIRSSTRTIFFPAAHASKSWLSGSRSSWKDPIWPHLHFVFTSLRVGLQKKSPSGLWHLWVPIGDCFLQHLIKNKNTWKNCLLRFKGNSVQVCRGSNFLKVNAHSGPASPPATSLNQLWTFCHRDKRKQTSFVSWSSSPETWRSVAAAANFLSSMCLLKSTAIATYCKFISVSSRGFGVGALNDNVLMSSWARAVQWGKLHVGTNEDNFLLVRWSIGTRCQPDLSGPKQQKPLPLLQPPHLGSSRLLSQAKDMKSKGSFKQAQSCKCKSIPNQSFPSQRHKSTRLSIRVIFT